MKRLGWLLLAPAPALASALACGEGLPWRAEAQGWRVAFESRPAPLPLGRHFELRGVVCPPAGTPLAVPQAASLRVDADMPAHRHGMNYRTRTQLAADGSFSAQGLLFHMPGRWRVLFDLQTASGPLRLQHELELK